MFPKSKLQQQKQNRLVLTFAHSFNHEFWINQGYQPEKKGNKEENLIYTSIAEKTKPNFHVQLLTMTMPLISAI